MRAASPLVLVSAVLAEPAPELKLPATKHKSQPTRLSVSCEISLQICTAPDSLIIARYAVAMFHLVSFRIDDPSKLSILGLVNLLKYIATFSAQGFDKRVEIIHAVTSWWNVL